MKGTHNSQSFAQDRPIRKPPKMDRPLGAPAESSSCSLSIGLDSKRIQHKEALEEACTPSAVLQLTCMRGHAEQDWLHIYTESESERGDGAKRKLYNL